MLNGSALVHGDGLSAQRAGTQPQNRLSPPFRRGMKIASILSTLTLDIVMRFNLKRDQNDLAVFRALQAAGRNPLRGRDADIYCDHVDGFGLLLEVKRDSKAKLRPIQEALQRLFRERYVRVESAEQALIACGVSL